LPPGKMSFTPSDKTCLNRFRLGLLLGLTVLVIVREPQLLIKPRLWAEEGTVWIGPFYSSGVFGSLTFLYSANSYFDLATNLFALLAVRVPIEFCPFVTTYLSFFYLLIIFCVILWNEGKLLEGEGRKFLCCLIVLLAPTHHEEIWLTSLHIKTYAGLCTLFLMVDEAPEQRAKMWFYRILLAFNTLSGPYSIVLSSPFLFSFLLDKKRPRERSVQLVIVLIGTMIQVGFVIFSVTHFGMDANRNMPISVTETATVVLKGQLLDPLLGPRAANSLFRVLQIKWPETGAPITPGSIKGSFLSILAIFSVWSILISVGRNSHQWFLAACWTLTGILTSMASLGHVPLNRYAVIPGVIVLFALLNTVDLKSLSWEGIRQACARREIYPIMRAIATAAACGLLVLSLCSGVFQFRALVYNDYRRSPSWESQVREWKQDHNYKIRIFPFGEWEMEIKEAQP